MSQITTADLKEYRVIWWQCPTSHHTSSVVYVKALNEEDAKAIARDHIERRLGITWLQITSVGDAPEVPKYGHVVHR